MGTSTIEEKEKGKSCNSQPKDNKAASPYYYRARLVNLLSKHEPSRLHQVNDLLQQYKDREEELLESLACYYSGEQMYLAPLPPSDPRSASNRLRSRSLGAGIVHSCIIKMKSKLRNEIKFKSNSFRSMQCSELTQQTNRRYSLNPAHVVDDYCLENSCKKPVETIQVKCLDNGENVDINELNNQVEHSKLVCGVEFVPQTFREKLIVFFQKHDMSMVEKVDELIGFGGQTLDELWEEVQATYQVNQRERFIRLVRQFHPKYLVQVDDLLCSYAGQEEDLIASFRKKFCHAKRLDGYDNCTWKPGQANSYQILPSFDLGD